MKVENIAIEFTNSFNGVFFAGQQVVGNVKFQVNETIEVKGVILKCKGKARVSWSEGSGDDKRHYSAKEKYIDNEVNLLGANKKKSKDCPNVNLNAGFHSFPFDFTLPSTLPSSIEVHHGYVRYYVKVKVDRPSWHKDYKFMMPFTVVAHLDLNSQENAMKPNQITESKMICCLCCATGPVSAVFRIERTGYVPRESVQIFAEVKNESERAILKTKTKLYQKTVLTAEGHHNRRTTDLAKVEKGRIEGGGTDRWSGDPLLIPPCPPSYAWGCSIIDMDYWLEFTADIEDTPFDLDLQLPVIIGTIPLRTLYAPPATQYGGFAPPQAAQYGGFAPPPGISAPPPPMDSKPPEGFTDPSDITLQPMGGDFSQPITTQPGALPSAPPPSYQESVFSGSYINQSEDDTRESQFKPYYTYYDFSAQPK